MIPLSPAMQGIINKQPMGTLFDLDIPKNNEPPEDVEITTTILYMSKEELKEFKRLAKIGIKEMFGEEFQSRGNISDFLLKILKEKYGDR